MLYDQETILQRLSHHLKNFVGLGIEISPEMDLINQLAIDSIKLLNLVMEIEDEFDISIPISSLVDIHTVNDFSNLIYKIKSTSQ
ncbi:MAG: acyl carrier protein [Nitrosospira sp.]|nr:acyl carrier protein [Nitrosospira sp.]MDW7642672.1 acyl carrier protein [Nitrosomonadaceae bacterium]MBI0407320.1 acyl carrier protein [Nitrosospira sp.]MBI0414767.1 acyl carrier protein [Nitrosospira sp.]MBI0415319.1 acyl carrier protein [Nitrosospira sp.]